MADVRCYLVTYDISSPRRWRKVFRAMQGYGEHVQLSVFRCDLTPEQRVQMATALDALIHHGEDQVLVIDLGRSSPSVIRGIEVLGRPQAFRLPSARII
jgi:CRISPR-associated protein Cas2